MARPGRNNPEGKQKSQRGRGRPTKLTEDLILAMIQVVTEALYWTDEELLDELNEKLESLKQPTISQTTFEDYKANKQQASNPLMKHFSGLIKKALKKEKSELLKELRGGGNGWQAKAWILERKFDEWNLRKKEEKKVTGTFSIENLLNDEE